MTECSLCMQNVYSKTSKHLQYIQTYCICTDCRNQEGLTGHLRPQKCCPTWQLNNVKETQQASYVSQLFADLSLKLIFCRSKFLIRSL